MVSKQKQNNLRPLLKVFMRKRNGSYGQGKETLWRCYGFYVSAQGSGSKAQCLWPIRPKNWNLKANVYCYSLRGFLVMTLLQYCTPTEDWNVFSAYWDLLMCRTSIKLYVICLLKSIWFNELFKRGYCPISYFTALNLANCLSFHFPVSFMSWLTREEDQVNISWWLLF